MRLLVIGRSGQVARALLEKAGDRISVFCLGRPEADLTKQRSIEQAIRQIRPEIVINAGAYTAVDKAEGDLDNAFAVNCEGARNVSAATSQAGIPIIHLSTDYVFSGDKLSAYVETDPVGPLSVYGQTKLAGERAVSGCNPAHVILRTAWVYAPWGHNFAKTMLRIAETRDFVRVVADQRGAPTYAPDIADGIMVVARKILNAPRDLSWRGVFHMTAQGSTTWAGFAEAIFKASASVGGPSARVEPITTSLYPTPARRPANSRLDTSKFENLFTHRLPEWETSVKRFLHDLQRN